MKVCIIGAGSVGLGLAAFLLNAGWDVCFITRKGKSDDLKRGFRVYGLFGDFEFSASEYCVSEDYISCERCDYILITTKSYANREIAESLNRIKDKIESSKIVVAQNGWGNSEIFKEFFGKEKVYTARIITGFEREKPNLAKITVHADEMVIGNIFDKMLSFNVEDLVEALNNGGFEAKVSCEVDKHLWAKMLYNCALNPLGAIFGVEYGKLAESEHSKSIMNNVIDEIYDVMEACNYSTFWDTKESYKEIFYSKLIPITASHRSSMLQDIENGRKTEIESLNGVVVKLANEKNLSVPFNEFLYRSIKFLEK